MNRYKLCGENGHISGELAYEEVLESDEPLTEEEVNEEARDFVLGHIGYWHELIEGEYAPPISENTPKKPLLKIIEKHGPISNLGYLISGFKNANDVVVVTRHKTPVAALIPYELYQELKARMNA